MKKYTWDHLNDYDSDSDMGILTPDRCGEITHEEAVEELNELLVALHDAINSPLGVVPDTADRFYQPKHSRHTSAVWGLLRSLPS